jgi:hypothetical protein
MQMTSRTKKAALAALLLLIVAVAAYQLFFKPPVLLWDGSPGATHYEVEIDGTLLGTFTETRAPLPRGFVTSNHAVRVRACNGASCSPWQVLPSR